MPTISVIVPVYKVEAYLDACVESIVNQTYKDLEIILVDDGSPDNCPAMCDAWAKKDSRIKVIHKKNGGLSDARNTGMAIATGEYIGFVDSDDIINSKMYELLFSTIKKTKSDIVQCKSFLYYDFPLSEYPDISEKNEIHSFDNTSAIKMLLTENLFTTTCWNNLTVSTIAKNTMFEIGRINEDVLWTYRAFSKAKTVTHIASPLYGYYQRSGSIMNSAYTIKRFDALYALEQRAEEIRKDFPDLYPSALKNYAGGCMYHYQTLCRLPRTAEYKDFKKRIHKRFCETDLKTVFSVTSLKYKVWYTLFRFMPTITCKIRIFLKIGL